jgi:hypothetical protein
MLMLTVLKKSNTCYVHNLHGHKLQCYQLHSMVLQHSIIKNLHEI